MTPERAKEVLKEIEKIKDEQIERDEEEIWRLRDEESDGEDDNDDSTIPAWFREKIINCTNGEYFRWYLSEPWLYVPKPCWGCKALELKTLKCHLAANLDENFELRQAAFENGSCRH